MMRNEVAVRDLFDIAGIRMEGRRVDRNPLLQRDHPHRPARSSGEATFNPSPASHAFNQMKANRQTSQS